jgi:hypothetical protein
METQKSNKRLMARTITRRQKSEGQRKAKRRTAPRNQRKERELVPLEVGSYLTHGLSNVVYMQIVRSNSNKKYKTSITCQHNLPFYSKS